MTIQTKLYFNQRNNKLFQLKWQDLILYTKYQKIHIQV